MEIWDSDRMNIIICLKEAKHEEAMTKSLAYYSPGINIISYKKCFVISDTDVIITDDRCIKEKYPGHALLLSADIIKKDINLPNADFNPPYELYELKITDPVSQILRAAIHVYENNTGRKYIDFGVSEKIILRFFSPFGGVGTTCIAITFARLIKLKKSKNVLFISNNQESNYLPYIIPIREKIRPSSEMDFRLNTNRPVDILDYAMLDEFGVYYIDSQSDISILLNEATKLAAFDYILIDTKDSYCLSDYDGYIDILINSKVEKRTMDYDCTERIIINNFSDYNDISLESNISKKKTDLYLSKGSTESIVTNITGNYKGIICNIVKDEDAFKVSGNKVNIKLSSAFSTGVMNLLYTMSDR